MTAQDRPADTTIRARIWQLAALACATIVVLGLLLAWSLERSREANRRVERTQRVVRELQAYSRQFVEAETGQRGFLLTLQEEYLTPYRTVLVDNVSRSERLKRMIGDEASLAKLERLDDLFRDKLQELGETVRLAEAGDLPGALAIVREGRGRRYTLEFQQLSQEIADAATAELATRQAAAASEDGNIFAVVVIGSCLAILLVVVAAGRTVARIDGPLRDLLLGIGALAAGDSDRPVAIRSNDEIGLVAEAFNAMAVHLHTANGARERSEADLALTNRHLVAEVEQRAAAQAQLSRSLVELERSNAELDQFAYVASHDLKAPLRGIRNLADWIVEDVAGDVGPDTIENLALLHSRVERLDMLLDSLLQYSRVGRVGGREEDIDTARLVGEIAEYIAPPSGFSVSCRGEMPALRTEKAPLEQVLRNLIGNGLKHHDKAAGGVVVGARSLGDMIEFHIEDDGPGIATGFHERIFQMFQTLKSRDVLEGSGMGLAIVKKAVEGHGGTIRVDSAPPRRGTAFVFTWPRAQHPIAARPEG